jgi:hypothetical protein
MEREHNETSRTKEHFMAEPEEKQESQQDNGKNPGTDDTVTDQPDLGAGVGPGEDFDQVKEEPQEEEPVKIPRDPTDGMSPLEAKNFWKDRANHFDKSYKEERAKRQAYDRQYGGLNGAGIASKNIHEQARAVDRFTNLDIPNNVQDLASYTRYILNEAEKGFEAKLTERQLDGRVESTEKTARDAHNGEDGLPAYDELVDEYVAPLSTSARASSLCCAKWKTRPRLLTRSALSSSTRISATS